ncbi:MAG: hypothetical protein ACUVXJ_02865 [Phycisphaerae bacterium]
MSQNKPTRREFLKTTSAAMAYVTLAGQASATQTRPADASKILNYNPKMGYRRLGKTGLMISEISLGGHGGKTVEDRLPVLGRAIELGMNYVDNNIVEECALYGKAMKGKRNRWYIGFASWPEKLTSEYEKELSKEGMAKAIDDRLKAYDTDMLDLWRPVGPHGVRGRPDKRPCWKSVRVCSTWSSRFSRRPASRARFASWESRHTSRKFSAVC